MSNVGSLQKTLVFLLIFTAISSAVAYNLVIKAYDNVYAIGFYGE